MKTAFINRSDAETQRKNEDRIYRINKIGNAIRRGRI